MARFFLGSLAALLVAAGVTFAQNGGRQTDATVKLVDPGRNKAIITVFDGNGIRIMEIDIPPDTKFVDPKGKKIKGGLNSDLFKSSNNRPAVPITIQYGTGDAAGTIKKIVVR